ncbi:MerR family transcriptional regulator [Clostridiaceae bacterium OttesenSCG-928-D20]|nr:MerR family transcriptional regulator [Clostridiaceae bacterium OttesenSCG-928-D20]
MFKIGEFSKLTQVSIRMLRYYDELGLLIPAKTDKFTNHRFYQADQIPLLNKIIFLRDLGFNVSEIATTLNNWDNEYVSNKLKNKQLEIKLAIKSEQNKLSKIEMAQRDIQQERITMHYNVSIKSIPSFRVFSLRRTIPDYYAEGQLWKEMATFAKVNNISFPHSAFTIYHDFEYKEKDVDIELCSVVTELKAENTEDFLFRNTEPVPIMACTMVYGDYKNVAAAYQSFANWLAEHQSYRMIGQSRQIVHIGAWNESNPDNYLIEIQVPLEERIG